MERKTQFWLKRVFPQKQTYEKQDNPNIVAAVGVPPAEQVMGKALAYGGLDQGFHSLSNLIKFLRMVIILRLMIL